MRIAALAAHSDAPGVRGTALEYLDNVLPEPVRGLLLRRLGSDQPRPAAPRPDTRDELLKTAVHLAIGEDKPEEL
jgi:hypothetical protein